MHEYCIISYFEKKADRKTKIVILIFWRRKITFIKLQVMFVAWGIDLTIQSSKIIAAGKFFCTFFQFILSEFDLVGEMIDHQ